MTTLAGHGSRAQEGAGTTALPSVLLSFPLLGSLLALAIGLNTRSVLADPDTYWHLAVGQWIVRHRAVPTTDPFSHSMPGIAWTAHEWGSELILNGVYQLAGAQGLAALAAVCFAVTIAYILRFLLDRMEPVHAISLAAVSGGMMYTHFLARPHVLVWPITAVWIGTLVRAGERREAPPWWLLILLVIWANTHASFTLAIGFAGALALDAIVACDTRTARLEAVRRWGYFLAAASVLMLCNPQGIGALTYALQVMRMKETLALINEWQSASFHHFQPFLLWILLVFALALTGRLTLSLPRLLFVSGLFYLALKHQRYHALLGLVSSMLLAAPIAAGMRAHSLQGGGRADTLDRVFASLARPAARAGVAIALALAIALMVLSARFTPTRFNPSHTPEKAIVAFESTGAKGRVFNAYGFGGYLIFRGIPVFIDGRSDMYGDALMREISGATALRGPGKLEALLAKYDIGWTLLAPETAAVQLLDRLPAWRRVYGDSVAVVHVRNDLLRGAAPPSPASPAPQGVQ